jgi:hypothetical protein
MNPGADAFVKILKHPFKFRLFLFSRLPSAFFSGLRLKDANESRCVITVPYRWFTQNPFHSTYFACLAMAAEMSTGTLGMMHIYKRIPPVSMLVVSMEANYYKKASGLTTFICDQGSLILETIEKSISSGEGQTIKVRSTGTNREGELVAEFQITWSFKPKKV